MASTKLYRDTDQGKIGGVCAGLADAFGWDVTILRIVWVVSVFVFGTGLLLYLLAWIVMPKKSDVITPSTPLAPVAR